MLIEPELQEVWQATSTWSATGTPELAKTRVRAESATATILLALSATAEA